MTVVWNDGFIPKIERAVFIGILRFSEMVRTEGNHSIKEGPKTGRLYRTRGEVHQASAPGEPPASDLGGLIKSSRIESKRELLASTVIWSTAYARALEEGTNTIEPRPYARPALTKVLPAGVDAVREEIAAVLK